MSPRSLLVISLVLIVAAVGGGYYWGINSVAVTTPPATVAPTRSNRAVPVTKILPEKTSPGANFSLVGKMFAGDRLHRLSGFIAKLQQAQLPELNAMAHELNQRERTGYELTLERQLLLYRCGQINGPYFIRQKFTDNADQAVRANGIILEGWAHAEPAKALDWWRSLPSGSMKDSLLEPLVQGYLGGNGGTWADLEKSLTTAEQDHAMAPLLEGLIADQGLIAAMDWYQETFKPRPRGDYTLKNHAAHLLQDHVLRNPDFTSVQHWCKIIQRKENPMNQAELEALHRALGATGGIKALDLLQTGEAAALGLGERDRSRIAFGWAKAKPDEAGTWVKANAQHSARSDVAFHLALQGVSKDPAASRQWLPFMEGPLQQQAEEIIGRYESKGK
jgi:hypothetical protein